MHFFIFALASYFFQRLGSNSGISGSKSKKNKDKKGTDKSAADQQNTPVFEEAEGEKFENFENASLPEPKVSLASPYCVQSTSYDKNSPGLKFFRKFEIFWMKMHRKIECFDEKC